MTDDTWTTRDLPVLRAVVDIFDKTGDVVDANSVMRVVGFDKDTVQRPLRALNTEPFFRDVTEVAGGENLDDRSADRPRAARGWPVAVTRRPA
jgi:hypothetical protein